MKKVFTAFWEYLIAWSETMAAYRRIQGRNFNNHI
jgi:hypothetical protein